MPQEDETRLRVCDKAVHAGLLTRTCFFGVLGFLLPLLLGSSVDLTGTLDWAPSLLSMRFSCTAHGDLPRWLL